MDSGAIGALVTIEASRSFILSGATNNFELIVAFGRNPRYRHGAVMNLPTAGGGAKAIGGMPDYRIYLLGRNGRDETLPVKLEQVACPSDHEAVLRAITLIDDQHSAEIWESARLVAILPPKKSQAS